MQIGKDTVVSINYVLTDSTGKLLEKPEEPVSYLHGGYDGIFAAVEVVLEGKQVGDTCEVRMEPEDAFGDYDEQLVRVEPIASFPENIAVGMQFEGAPEGASDYVLYTVTDIADGSVVVDGNHPYSGKSLVFSCTVTDVREASADELTHGHAHGPHGHGH